MLDINKNRAIGNFLKVYVVCSFLFLFYGYILIKLEVRNYNNLVLFLFVFIAVVSLYFLFKEINRNSYSLSMMHWFFCFIFYGVAGFIQYINNSFVYSIQLSETRLIYVLIIIITWIFFFYLGVKSPQKNVIKKGLFNSILNSKIKLNYFFIVFSTILSLVILVYVISQSGISAMMSRETGEAVFSQSSQSQTLLFSALMRNVIVYGLAISIIYYRIYRKGLLLITVQFISCLIVNSPIGMARFNTAIIYIGLMLLLIPLSKKSIKYIVIFSLGFIVIFPMINIFRYTSLADISFQIIADTMDGISTNFLQGDYDAFSMIINTVDYIGSYGISFGYQFLGAILFFIPRAIWLTKPVGSGHTIRTAQGEQFANVSSPLVAESLMNFGFIGVIIFAFVIGKIISRIDLVYWEKKEHENSQTYIQILYPFLLSMFFFMNRGDLLSTFSFAMSHIVVFSFMFVINNMFFSKLSK